MEHIGTVATEGDPLLVADAEVLRAWKGISGEDETDYERACGILEGDSKQGAPIVIDGGRGVLWDPEGPGVTDVVLGESGTFIIVRTWLAEDQAIDAPAIVTRLAELPLLAPIELGTFELRSGVAVVMCAGESGAALEPRHAGREGQLRRDIDVEGTGLLFSLPPGVYRAAHDLVTREGVEARRCHFERIKSIE